PVGGATVAPVPSGPPPASFGWGGPTLTASGTAAAPAPVGGVREAAHPFRGLRRGRVLQVLDLYLVLEGSDGIVVVDQHALHERVLYERFKQRHAARGAAAVQRLLVPEVVELVPSDKRYVLESRDALAAE